MNGSFWHNVFCRAAVCWALLLPSLAQAQGVTILQEAWTGQGGGAQPSAPSALSGSSGATSQVFQGLLRQLFPLTPEQLQEVRRRDEEFRLLAARPPSGIVYRSVLRRIGVDPANAATRAQQLRLAIGNVTTLVFADSAGNPWPVRSVTVGSPQGYQAQILGEDGRQHMVVVSPLTDRIVQANLMVALAGLNVPLVFSVEGAPLSGEVDYMVEVVVSGRGPLAEPLTNVLERPLPDVADRGMQGFVDGVVPGEAVRVATDRGDVAAWLWRGKMVVRTGFEVLAPRPSARVRHVSGIGVFVFDRPASSLLVVETSTGRTLSVAVRLDRPLDAVSSAEAARVTRPFGVEVRP